jgi:hypothetical protein
LPTAVSETLRRALHVGQVKESDMSYPPNGDRHRGAQSSWALNGV